MRITADGDWLAAQKLSKSWVLRWKTLKGSAAIVLFTVLAFLIEYLIVVYAINLGVKEENSVTLPWTNWTVSPLFHLVPVSAVIVLVCSWICMTRYAAAKPTDRLKPPQKRIMRAVKKAETGLTGKIKSRMLEVKVVGYVWSKLKFAEATVKSAIITLLLFSALILLVSVAAYPRLIYNTFAGLYNGNNSLMELAKTLNIMLKGFAETLAPIWSACSAVNNALIYVAPSFRGLASTLGTITKPLVDLPPAGKYLVFQNVSSWFSALIVLLYGAYTRKSYRYRKPKRS